MHIPVLRHKPPTKARQELCTHACVSSHTSRVTHTPTSLRTRTHRCLNSDVHSHSSTLLAIAIKRSYPHMQHNRCSQAAAYCPRLPFPPAPYDTPNYHANESMRHKAWRMQAGHCLLRRPQELPWLSSILTLSGTIGLAETNPRASLDNVREHVVWHDRTDSVHRSGSCRDTCKSRVWRVLLRYAEVVHELVAHPTATALHKD